MRFCLKSLFEIRYSLFGQPVSGSPRANIHKMAEYIRPFRKTVFRRVSIPIPMPKADQLPQRSMIRHREIQTTRNALVNKRLIVFISFKKDIVRFSIPLVFAKEFKTRNAANRLIKIYDTTCQLKHECTLGHDCRWVVAEVRQRIRISDRPLKRIKSRSYPSCLLVNPGGRNFFLRKAGSFGIASSWTRHRKERSFSHTSARAGRGIPRVSVAPQWFS